MAILGMIIVGFIVGVLARFLLPGRDPMGFIMTTLLGIVGAVIAGFLGQAMGFYLPGEPAGFLASIIGAFLVLLIYRKLAVRHA